MVVKWPPLVDEKKGRQVFNLKLAKGFVPLIIGTMSSNCRTIRSIIPAVLALGLLLRRQAH
jgi:hypothetical protein